MRSEEHPRMQRQQEGRTVEQDHVAARHRSKIRRVVAKRIAKPPNLARRQVGQVAGEKKHAFGEIVLLYIG